MRHKIEQAVLNREISFLKWSRPARTRLDQPINFAEANICKKGQEKVGKAKMDKVKRNNKSVGLGLIGAIIGCSC